jgi:hypothetical protein
MIVSLRAASAHAQVEAMDPLPVREPRLPMAPADAVHPQPDPPFERPVILAQAGMAAAIPVFAFALGFAERNEPRAAIPIVLLTPLLVGAAVGTMGNASEGYRGSYRMAIGGAYLGAVTIIPLMAIGAAQWGGNGDTTGYKTAYILGGIAWFAIQPAVSIAFWHLGKRSRRAPPPATPPPSYPGRLPAGPTRGLSQLPGELTAPLLSLSF